MGSQACTRLGCGLEAFEVYFQQKDHTISNPKQNNFLLDKQSWHYVLLISNIEIHTVEQFMFE